ncbi:hypothetical protein [Williamsia sp. DF01-3]|uniref:hypothetical protein n=1 Tax=Williamsia sp. DF01-3 TaxID=2934157 RepID=UPI001FF33720|nr:hypothetical protein [Williamsia sp. DF01-3]MCK0516981.1 hypothetical protein [Williamsia sp. DF01-3]
MSGDWSLEWRSGSLYDLVNRTGEDVTSVRFSAHGPMVSGMFGQRDWTQTVDAVPNGGGIQKVFKAAYGAKANPPYILVEWTDPAGQEWTQHLEVPHN